MDSGNQVFFVIQKISLFHGPALPKHPPDILWYRDPHWTIDFQVARRFQSQLDAEIIINGFDENCYFAIIPVYQGMKKWIKQKPE